MVFLDSAKNYVSAVWYLVEARVRLFSVEAEEFRRLQLKLTAATVIATTTLIAFSVCFLGLCWLLLPRELAIALLAIVTAGYALASGAAFTFLALATFRAEPFNQTLSELKEDQKVFFSASKK